MAIGLEHSSPSSSSLARQSAGADESPLLHRYQAVRRCTTNLCQPLETEDYAIQSMPDASPVKWHLAHTSWFFETFILGPHQPNYRPFHPQFSFLFNSYYNAVGPRWARFQRGLLSRPSVAEIYKYRVHVDEHMAAFLQLQPAEHSALAGVIELGLQHEQQHQELILTDVKYLLTGNPLRPAYHQPAAESGAAPPALAWVSFPEGLAEIGFEGSGFAFDNEGPRHRVYLQGFRLANRLATNEDYLQFMADGGYDRPEFWLSDGWATRQARDWRAPLYWEKQGEEWFTTTLAGLCPLEPQEPVCHLSFYEANAFARWAGARLPTEAEWERAAAAVPLGGHFQDSGRFHPSAKVAADEGGPLYQLFGDVWQWTASPYVSYPGYEPPAGALGEYNGKFMCNQLVLRGASCATPRSHARLTYRNFFPPDARWQFSGVRLAKDL